METSSILAELKYREKHSIASSPEFRDLHDRYEEALYQGDTPEALRTRGCIWARAEYLWNYVPDIPTPDVPPGGTPVAMRMAA